MLKKIAPPVLMIAVAYDFLTFCHGVGLMRARTRARLWTVFWKENFLFIFPYHLIFPAIFTLPFCELTKLKKIYVLSVRSILMPQFVDGLRSNYYFMCKTDPKLRVSHTDTMCIYIIFIES